jgi:sphinganine-1-phosphate aldolase
MQQSNSQSAQSATKFPSQGSPWSQVKSELSRAKDKDVDWRSGKLPAYIYYLDDALHEVVTSAYQMYFSENALGRRAFPSVDRLEREVVEMGLDLFNAGEGGAGSFTSGGTESIFLAVKTARDFAVATRPGLERPNIVLPYSGHAAFNKSGHYLGLEVRRASLTADLRGDVDAMRALVDDNTVLLVGSAPSYPHGRFDDISAFGALALEKDVLLHVDACFGGFVSPFAADVGYDIPPFDFRVPGVTSLSADLHKYGFAAKGASLLMYRNADLKRHQIFEFAGWARGIYSTETFSGSRPAGSVAAAWAVVNYLGREGYGNIARLLLGTRDKLIVGIRQIEELELFEPVEHCIVLYRSRSPDVDTNAVAQLMGERGWFVGRTDHPAAICIAMNPKLAPVIDIYLEDLRKCVDEARRRSLTGELDMRTY